VGETAVAAATPAAATKAVRVFFIRVSFSAGCAPDAKRL